jgi:ATP-dependent Zn protease
MGIYEIKIDIKVNEISPTESEMKEPVKTREGGFKITLSEETASSIDKCEQAFLKLNYTAVREALAQHLTELSKKKPLLTKKKEEEN